jgi:transcriptional regulator with XRE-family HTH domain
MLTKWSIDDAENISIVVALKATRAILGISQMEMAERLGISKATLARVETMEGSLKAPTFLRAIKLFKELGVQIDNHPANECLKIEISNDALKAAYAELKDPSKRRPDRKKSD